MTNGPARTDERMRYSTKLRKMVTRPPEDFSVCKGRIAGNSPRCLEDFMLQEVVGCAVSANEVAYNYK